MNFLDKNYKAFFVLLRAGLWGTTPDPALFVSFTGTQWQALLALAQKQAVLGLIYSGVSRLPKELMPNQQMLLRLYGFSEQIRKNNAKIVAVAQEVCGWFKDAGLDPIILKGLSVGIFYAEPDLRQPGDIDLFFHRDYENVVAIVQSRGIKVKFNPHHDTFVYQGVLVELHREPCDLVRSAIVDFTPVEFNYIKNTFQMLNPVGNAFLLLMHAANHFMASGLGLRQFCDWAAFLKQYADSNELEKVWRLVQKQGAGVFACEFTALAVEVLGVELDEQRRYLIKDSIPYKREVLLQELIRQGNFGDRNLPHRGEFIKWLSYAGRKFQMTIRVYSFFPNYIWARFGRRIQSVFQRLLKNK